MGRVKEGLRRLTKSPGVPQARHIAERSVTPHLRADFHQLGLDHGLTVERLSALELKVDRMYSSVDALDAHIPAVLNAIASTNGTTRLLARETDGLRASITDMAHRLDEADETVAHRLDEVAKAMWTGDEIVRDELRPHIETLAWLLERVETVRSEMMHELRYGQTRESAAVEPKILNAAHLGDADIRLNLGAGHIAIDGFVNVDMRELPGIDVVAPIDSLPFEPGTIAEIFSSHTVEHFPEEQLRRETAAVLGRLAQARWHVPRDRAGSRGHDDGVRER